MTRRLAAVLLALAAACPCAPAAHATTGGDRPNIVVLMTDDQTVATLRYMHDVKQLLMRQGTTFDRMVATYPLCCPSRATFLTGQYAHNHGVIHNAGPHGGYPALDHTNTLPLWLQAAGYRTMHVGRYLNGYGTRVDPLTIPPGWDDWLGSPEPGAFDYAEWTMNENGVLLDYAGGDYQTDVYAQKAAGLIEQAAADPRPFFLNVWFAAPHSGRPHDPDDPRGLVTPSPAPWHRDAFKAVPLPRPPNFNRVDRYDQPQEIADRPPLTAQQIAAIQENWQQELETLLSVDQAVETVVAALEQTGQLSNTLIMLVSDNGFMHGEHRVRSEKVLPYEPSIRVPLIMRGPGVPRGHRDRRLVGNIDLAPTIVAAARASAARVMDGISLLPLLADPRRRTGRELLLEDGAGASGVPPFRGIRNDRFKYVEYLGTGEYELYDLRRDPYELHNLDGHDRYLGIEAAMARRLRSLRRCGGSACRLRPRVHLLVRSRIRRTGGRRCIDGDLRVRLSGRERRRLDRMDVFLNRRRVAAARRPPFLRRVPYRDLRRGRRALLRTRAELNDGRVLTLDRRLLACR